MTINKSYLGVPPCGSIEQVFSLVLIIMLYHVVVTVESVDETLMFDHSSESY